jgi:predicted CopG family antitoxin
MMKRWMAVEATVAIRVGSTLDGPGVSVPDKCMAVKTITIDLDAYDALARHKRAGQSFSEVIKERFRSGSTGRDLLEAVRHASLDESALPAAADEIARRRRHRARAARL